MLVYTVAAQRGRLLVCSQNDDIHPGHGRRLSNGIVSGTLTLIKMYIKVNYHMFKCILNPILLYDTMPITIDIYSHVYVKSIEYVVCNQNL